MSTNSLKNKVNTNGANKSGRSVLDLIARVYEKDRETTADSVPLYQNLSDAMRRLIVEGQLPQGERLPTLSELAKELNVSRGTVTHAYNLLENQGYVSLTQGRGSFVSHDLNLDKTEVSRKDSAIKTIHNMLTELRKLNFSRREIQIFIDLKMREFYEEAGELQVAVVTNSFEERIILLSELSRIKSTVFTGYSFESFLDGSFDVDVFDAIICSEEIYLSTKLRLDAGQAKRLLPVVFDLDHHSAIDLAQLNPDTRLGILSFGHTFSKRMYESCEMYANLHNPPLTHLLGEGRLEPLLEECDTILFSYASFDFLKEEQRELLEHFVKKGGDLLQYKLMLEKASYLGIMTNLEALADKGKELM